MIYVYILIVQPDTLPQTRITAADNEQTLASLLESPLEPHLPTPLTKQLTLTA